MAAQSILMILNNPYVNDSRVTREAESLAKAGYNVVIKCFYQPGLKINETNNQVTVRRISPVPKSGGRLFSKIMLVLWFNLKILFGRERFDIIHCHDLVALPVGVLLKWFSFNRLKIIYDAHEFETECRHLTGIIKICYEVTEKFFIKYANHVICVSNSIAKAYVSRYQIPKPTLILNCPPRHQLDVKESKLRTKLKLQADDMVLVYIGNLGAGRGVEFLLSAFENLSDRKKKMVFIGSGSLSEQVTAVAANNENIYYHPSIPHHELLDFIAGADVGVFMCENICLSYYYCLPNKLFEYIQAGLPVIVSNLFELAQLVNTYQIGLTVDYNIKQFVKHLLKLNKKDLIKFRDKLPIVQQKYCWEQQEQVLIKLYQGLT